MATATANDRIVYPIGLHYPGCCSFTDFARNCSGSGGSGSDDERIFDSSGRYRNVLGIDALEYTDVSCSGGTIRRMCARVGLFVPWTPVLYLAARPHCLVAIKRDVNLTLCANNVSSENALSNASIAVAECCSVKSLVRAGDRVIWSILDMTLYELRFESFHARSVALRFLKENAHARANDYTLFAATDNACFEVALTSYFRKTRFDRRILCANAENTDGRLDYGDDVDDDNNNDDTDEDDEEETKNNGDEAKEDDFALGGTNLDLHAVFEVGSWCRVRDGNASIAGSGGSGGGGGADIGYFLQKLNTAELSRNKLPDNPLARLPVVSYDLETIARADSTLPRGVENDQRLSSLAVTIHCERDDLPEIRRRRILDEGDGRGASKNDDAVTTAIVLAYAPLKSRKALYESERAVAEILRRRPNLERTTVVFFRDERDLVYHALEMLMTNEFFAHLFELDDPADAAKLACVLIGYNSWEYDYAFLVNRAIYYDYVAHAIRLLWLQSEPRFHYTQLSFDLMLHVRSRYGAQVGSVALKHVSRFFGAADAAESGMSETERGVKMHFDAVAIRRLYFAANEGVERFDESAAFGDLIADKGVNMLRVLLYNITDCTAVYYLMRNLSFLNTVELYARHFLASLVEASHAGNSRLLPNAFTAHALREGNTVLPFRQNRLSVYSMPPASVAFVRVASSRQLAERQQRQLQQQRRSKQVKKTPPENNVIAEISYKSRRRVNVAPINPIEAHLWYQGARNSATTNPMFAPMHDQLRLMRIDDDKVYVGGINSATSGHYSRPICVDFTSFYPSIGCQYGLSMETVYVLTVGGLMSMFSGDEVELNHALRMGTLRCFDYEPIDSPRRLSASALLDAAADDEEETMSRYAIKGRDDFAAAVIRQNGGWYEGVEFANAREMIASSANVDERRVLVVMRSVTTNNVAAEAVATTAAAQPVICSLWQHYLRMRKNYKRMIRELPESDVFRRRVLGCMEKMFKVVANSLYGYLNYKRSIVYSPQVAAAVTLLSRKTFYETAWLCEVAMPLVARQRDLAISVSRKARTRSEAEAALRAETLRSTTDSEKRILLTLYPPSEEDPLSATAAATTTPTTEGAEIRRRVYRKTTTLRRDFEARVSTTGRFSFARWLLDGIGDNDVARLGRLTCEVVYRDTDGLMIFPRSNERALSARQQAALERTIVRLVNDSFARYDYRLISLDLEDSGIEFSSVMGKKKYWKTLNLARDRFVTKGFEKNAQSYVKHVVRVLQRNTAALLTNHDTARCRVVVHDFEAFFGGVFSALNAFYREHGVDAFSFNLALNPRGVTGAEAAFIQDTIERYNYNPGDRARCVFVLGLDNPLDTVFMLAGEFRPERHTLNYYKVLRRLAVYFVQLVEGFKRSLEPQGTELYMSARSFDEHLRHAYSRWLVETNRGENDTESRYSLDPFFRSQPLEFWRPKQTAADEETTTTIVEQAEYL